MKNSYGMSMESVKTYQIYCILITILLNLSVTLCWSQDKADALKSNKHYILGDSLMKLGRYDQAIISFKNALSAFEKKDYLNQSALLNKIAEGYWRSGQLNDAQEAGKEGVRLLEKVPDNKEQKLLLGNIYNNLCIINSLSGNFEEGIAFGLQSMETYRQDSVSNLERLSSVYNRLGWTYYNAGDVNATIYYNKLALTIRENQYGFFHKETAGSYNNIGIAFADKGNNNEALWYLGKALAIYQELYSSDHPSVANVYFNIGTIYHSQNERHRALEHYLSALRAFEKKPITYYLEISNALNNIALIYSQTNNYQESITWHQRAVKFRKKYFGASHPLLAYNYNNLGTLQHQVHEDSLALKYYRKALELQKSAYDEPHIEMVGTYTNIGSIHLYLKEYQKALWHFKQAEKIEAKISLKHPYIVRLYNLFTKTYLELGELNKAEQSHHMALSANNCNQTVFDNPGAMNTEMLDPGEFINSIYWASSIQLNKYVKNNNLSDLELGLNKILSADKIIDRTRRFQTRLGDKLDIGDNLKKMYGLGISICHYLFDKTLNHRYMDYAFYFSEKAKGSVLRGNLTDQLARSFDIIPSSVLKSEQEIKDALSYHQSQILDLESSDDNNNLEKVKVHENEIFSLHNSLDSLIQLIELQHSIYFDLKYQNNTMGIKEIQNQLATNEGLIEYFDADSTLFVFTISSDSINFLSIPLEKDFDNMVDSFRNLITKDHAHTTGYNNLSFEVFRKYLSKPLSTLDGEIKNLILIPDGQLFDLNFDILLYESGDIAGWKNLPYLFKKYAISYANSGTAVFQDTKTLVAQPEKDLLAFSFGKNDDVPGSMISLSTLRSRTEELPGSSAEIKALSNLIDGDYFYGNQANEKRFKDVAANYRILHLAIHGETNNQEPENSKLYFFSKGDSLEDGKLHAFELYNMRLNADLAVLSACNTGSGKIVNGEGVMTLGRAFAYAGVNSILLTRREISDAVAPDIIRFFYRELKNGKRKSEALRQAKLEFLETANNISANPLYWSSFYILGDDSPIRFNNGNPSKFKLGLGGLLLVLVLFFYYRRLKASTKS